MEFMPRLAAGAIFAQDPKSDTPAPALVGSCAAFTSRDIFITAAHCVDTNDDLYVALEGEPRGRRVIDRTINPATDIALLKCTPAEMEHGGFDNQYFVGLCEVLIDGADYSCYGYPAEPSGGKPLPVGRTIRGNVQRMFLYDGWGGRKYLAFELSAAAQPGLSGSALAYNATPKSLAGVVTANVDSYVLIDRIEDVEKDGRVYREQISRVVSYGIAATAVSARTWISEEIERMNASW